MDTQTRHDAWRVAGQTAPCASACGRKVGIVSTPQLPGSAQPLAAPPSARPGERPGRGRPGSRRGQPRGRRVLHLVPSWPAGRPGRSGSAASPSPADGRRARRTPDRPPQGSCAGVLRWPSPSCSRSASARSWRATRTSSPRSKLDRHGLGIAASSPAASPASRTHRGHRIISAQPAAGKPGQPRRSPIRSARRAPTANSTGWLSFARWSVAALICRYSC